MAFFLTSPSYKTHLGLLEDFQGSASAAAVSWFFAVIEPGPNALRETSALRSYPTDS